MNFIFISPNFPEGYYQFCRSLKNHGVNVLGIGDAPYDLLKQELKDSLNEYYKVSSLENFDEVYKAVAFFSFKYGKIDWLESNNEYWLMKDAKLRTEFNINSGIKSDEIDFIKYKSKMKEFYAKANIKTARYHLCDNIENAKEFINKVGYPLVVKPDNGVGANATYKLKNEEDLINFYNSYDGHVQYIMEEFVDGDLISFDGIANSKREPIFVTSHVFPEQIMDVVNDISDMHYYSLRQIPEDLYNAGLACLKAFPTERRFFHLEFFKLRTTKEGLGNKGDIIGLEVNMRPPGGYTPDLMNYANNINVYDIWADMVTKDDSDYNRERPYYCCYVGRRDIHEYVYSLDEVKSTFNKQMRISQRIPDALSDALGNESLCACFEEIEEMNEFVDMAMRLK